MQYKFFLTGRSGVREVFPSNNKTLEFSYSKESNRADFTRELEGSIILNGQDFDWLYENEVLIYRCDLIGITIHKRCDGLWNEDWFEANISLNSGKWDLDKCMVELTIKKFDRYQCFEDNAEDEIDVMANTAKVNVSSIEGNLETENFHQTVNPGGQFIPFPGESEPAAKGWRIVSQRYNSSIFPDDPFAGDYYIDWARETKYSTTPLEGWISLGGNNYARSVLLHDMKNDPFDSQFPNNWGYTYKLLSTPFTNGMLLKDVFNHLLGFACPGLTLESDFFQWNPVHSSYVNYVTGKPSRVRNLVLFQKSDIKRPFDTGRANSAKITFKKLLDDICTIFQLEWEITEDDKFKIEHVSYRNRSLSLDTTTVENSVLNLGNRSYSYENDDIPKREVFTWMDDTSYGDFKGNPIIYTNSCAGNGDNKEASFDVQNITTDVVHCLNNYESDSKLVSDSGFVLMACSDGFGILREGGFRGNTVNNTLAWHQLHRDYWRHNRALLNFKTNNEATLAITTKPTKLQEKVRYRICCASDFDTEGLIKTALGDNGVLKSATFNLYKDMLEMSVLFPAEGELTENDPPVANPDFADTFKDIPVKIDVLANDTDDGNIVPSTLTLVNTGSNGIATITDDWQILFTPTANFIGTGYCSYQVRDEYGEISNVATVTIAVQDGTPLPVANGSSFVIAKNRELTKGSGALTANDTAPTLITVKPESKATSQGGTVIINSNGSCSYVPAFDFVGVDTFAYTIRDNYSNESTGTITINVFEPETVYVVLEKTGDGFPSSIIEDCGMGSQIVGQQELATLRIKTYSDAGYTLPLDVTGYNLKVKLKQKITYFEPSRVYESTLTLSVASGSDYLYAENALVYIFYFGCGGGGGMTRPESHYEILLSLEPGDGYEI